LSAAFTSLAAIGTTPRGCCATAGPRQGRQRF
jgi:hypothetical protein